MIRVVNKSKHSPTGNDIYIGRGSILGNPYTCKELSNTKALYQCSSREESIESYKIYLLDKISEKNIEICDIMNKIYKQALIGDVNLICYCKPNDCHGDIIKEIIESKIILNKIWLD